MTLKARAALDGQWSALAEATFTATELPLRVSEVMYHPAGGGEFEADEYEFIELTNVSRRMVVDLEGVSFTEGIHFTFGPGRLAPGERIVVAANEAALRERYGEDFRIAGTYGDAAGGSRLSNAGERIVLVDARGRLIQEFAYSDDWHRSTDGDGRSLEASCSTATNRIAGTARTGGCQASPTAAHPAVIARTSSWQRAT